VNTALSEWGVPAEGTVAPVAGSGAVQSVDAAPLMTVAVSMGVLPSLNCTVPTIRRHDLVFPSVNCPVSAVP
jgi:hypothetical protein